MHSVPGPGTQRVGGVLVGVSGAGKLESAAIILAVGWIVVVAVFQTCAAVCGRGLSPVFLRMIVQESFSTTSPDPQGAGGDGNQLPPPPPAMIPAFEHMHYPNRREP